MNLHIRPFSPDDLEEVVQLSLLAWAPVFHSFEQVLGTKIYSLLFPDWKQTAAKCGDYQRRMARLFRRSTALLCRKPPKGTTS